MATGGGAPACPRPLGAAACCALPQAASNRAMAATVDARGPRCTEKLAHLGPLRKKKATLADMADAPGGGSLALA